MADVKAKASQWSKGMGLVLSPSGNPHINPRPVTAWQARVRRDI